MDNIEEAKRTIRVALELGTGVVRIFGKGDLTAMSRVEAAEIGRDCVEAILQLDGAENLKWAFETHDNWIRSDDCALLLDRIPHANVGVLWDMGHTSRVGREKPAETFRAVNGRIFYTHIKDAIYDPSHPKAMADGWRYVIPGSGQLPLEEAVRLLKKEGFDGWVNFEHEKRWHPELDEPEIIFPAFAKWVRPIIE